MLINSIENSKCYAKHRLSKFKGIKKENFLLYFKGRNFRCNIKTTHPTEKGACGTLLNSGAFKAMSGKIYTVSGQGVKF